MVWVVLNKTSASTTDMFGADEINKINKTFRGDLDVEPIFMNTNFTFRNGKLFLRNPGDSASYNIATSAITTDKTITLPLLTAHDTLVTQAFTQPLTNKTIDAALNTIIGFPTTSSNNIFTGINYFNTDNLRLTAPTSGFRYRFRGLDIAADRAVSMPLLTANDIFLFENHPTTITGLKTFNPSTLGVKSSGAGSYLFEGNSIAENRTVTIPALTGNDTFGFLGQNQLWTGDHLVAHNKLRVQVANGTNFISFNLPALTTSIGVTFPNLAVGDTFVFENHPTTLAGKTIPFSTNTLTDVLSTNTNQDITGIKTFADNMLRIKESATGFTAIINASGLSSGRTYYLPNVSNNPEFLLSQGTQSISGNKRFNDDVLHLFNPAGTALFRFRSSAITTDRMVNLPLLLADDTLTFDNHPATLKGKTMNAVDNAMLNQEVYPEAKRLVGGWNGGSATIGGWGFANGLMATVGTISYLQGTAIGKAASFASAASVNAQAGIRLLDGGGGMLHDRFRFKCKIRYQNIPSTSGARVFVGVTNRSNGFLSGEDPLNGLRGALMCLRANDTTWQFAHNDHLDAGVYDNTGVARNTTTIPFVWEIRAVSDTELQWRYNEGTWSASVTTEIPQLSAPLYPVLMIESVDGTAKTFDTRYWYMEIQSTV